MENYDEVQLLRFASGYRHRKILLSNVNSLLSVSQLLQYSPLPHVHTGILLQETREATRHSVTVQGINVVDPKQNRMQEQHASL